MGLHPCHRIAHSEKAPREFSSPEGDREEPVSEAGKLGLIRGTVAVAFTLPGFVQHYLGCW